MNLIIFYEISGTVDNIVTKQISHNPRGRASFFREAIPGMLRMLQWETLHHAYMGNTVRHSALRKENMILGRALAGVEELATGW